MIENFCERKRKRQIEEKVSKQGGRHIRKQAVDDYKCTDIHPDVHDAHNDFILKP